MSQKGKGGAWNGGKTDSEQTEKSGGCGDEKPAATATKKPAATAKPTQRSKKKKKDFVGVIQ